MAVLNNKFLDIENHTQAVKILLDDLIRFDIIKAYDEITGVGHRVVAGGEYFKESTVVEGDVLEKVEELRLVGSSPQSSQCSRCSCLQGIVARHYQCSCF